ncbi:hypothetical protein OUZ56_011984 [Daphnia magna]|uniref:Uncharacterized protein n=1 Tax=Daphnia magna TaxID=35525 RepID=A0ABQ9Z1Q0_9CRUS|nr:hypothetical protein OUZ56_011984 [Daphnia magna]
MASPSTSAAYDSDIAKNISPERTDSENESQNSNEDVDFEAEFYSTEHWKQGNIHPHKNLLFGFPQEVTPRHCVKNYIDTVSCGVAGPNVVGDEEFEGS